LLWFLIAYNFGFGLAVAFGVALAVALGVVLGLVTSESFFILPTARVGAFGFDGVAIVIS
jgi:hypothetical protein